MSQVTSKGRTGRKFAPLGIIFALLGLLLFAYFIRKAGVDQIVEGISRLGYWFGLVLLLAAARQFVRSLAWTQCFEPPHKLKLLHAIEARIMGDALGNIVPLASIAVSEPSKAVFVRDRVPLLSALAALALENIFYSLSVALFIFSGTTALMLSFSMPKPLRYASIGALSVTALIVPLGYLVIRNQWRFISGLLRFLNARSIAVERTGKALGRAAALEDQIYGFYARNRGKLIPIFLLELCFHLAGVTEIYLTLSFISDLVAPTLLTAFILESVNRIINVAFKFMPFRMGVDEAGTGMLAKVLGFLPAVGVTLAIVRKGRDIFWTTVGVLLMVRRGLSLRVMTQPEELHSQET